MTKKRRSAWDIDMLHGPLWDKIIIFALPLALTGVMQQLLNTADVAVLGRFVGKNAIAAVGNNISLIGLTVSLFMGLSLGANVVIAQNIGAKRTDEARSAVHTAVLAAVATGFLVFVVGEILVAPVMELLAVPPDVRDMAEAYLRIYLAGMPVIGLYNFEAAIFRSRGDTRTPLIALAAASSLNLALNLLFVANGFGVHGVAWATVAANATSAAILFWTLMRTDGVIRIKIKRLRIDKKQLRAIVGIGLPAGIQGMVFSLSNLIIQSAINSLGADVMAASAAAFTIEINVFCIINAFGQAATTFVSQNYGAGNLARCRRATRTAMLLNVAFMGTLSVFILLFAEPLLAFFNNDPRVVAFGKIRLFYVVAPEIINVVMEGLSGAMRGYGISLLPAMLTLVGICGIRITWVYTVFAASPDYETLMTTYPVSWFVTALFLCGAYKYSLKHLKYVDGLFEAPAKER